MAQPILPKLPQVPNRPVGGSVGWVPDNGAQRQAMKAGGQNKADTYDILIQAATVITSVMEAVYDIPIRTIAYSAQAAIEADKLREARGETGLAKLARQPNPLFAQNGIIDGAPSPVTQQYFVSRRRKKTAAAATQFFGNLSSLVPVTAHVNVPGTVYHGQATALTMMHLTRLAQIAAANPGAADLQDWCKLVATAKAMKLVVRGGQLVGSVIPAASMPSSVAAAVAKTGIKLTTIGACYAAAAAIHWAAHVEQGWAKQLQPLPAPAAGPATGARVPNFSRPTPRTSVPNFSRPLNVPAAARPVGLSGKGAGPASAIFREIFTKRGGTLLFGSFDISALIKEPAGWLALGDKLMLV